MTDVVATNIPAQLSTFIGREAEMAAAGRFLDAHRLVTLTGAGGCGKTRLALRVAADRVERHPDGVWYVELAAIGVDAVERQIADVLGVSDDGGRPLLAALADRIGSGQVLLILDNCEHLVDAVTLVVGRLVAACPALVVLATSRQPLGVVGEVSWRVPSMAMPSPSAVTDPAAAVGYDAVGLFVERAGHGRPGFVLDAGNGADVVEICRRLDGIPLAIELAAARVRQMGVGDILRGLDDRFRLLTGGAGSLLPRQQTLAASVEWSHGLLPGEARRVLRSLAVFGGSFPLDAVVAVVGKGGGGDRTDVGIAVGELVDRSLVQMEEVDGETRYRLLETVKAYGRDRLAEADGEADRARARHLAHHLDLAERAGPEIQARQDPVWLARLDRAYDDLRLALQWAHEQGDRQALLRLVAALGPYWHGRGRSGEGQRWFERALAGADAVPDVAARAMWGSAYLALYAADFELAATRADEALELATAIGQTSTVARSLDTLGSLQQYGDPIGAMVPLQRAADLAEAADDAWCLTDCLQKLGYSEYYRDRWPEAVAYGDRARVLVEQAGNPFFRGWADILDGTAAFRRGDLAAARRLHRRAWTGAEETREPLSLLIAGAMLCLCELADGDDEGAAGVIGRIEASLGEDARGSYYAAVVGALSSLVSLRRGAASAAAAALAEVCEALIADGVAFPTSDFLGWLAEAHLAAGDTSAARAVAARLAVVDETLQSRRAGPMVLYLRALAQLIDGRPDRADADARGALAGWLEADLVLEATDALELVAVIVGELGNRGESALLLSAAAGVRQRGGWVGRRAPQFDERAAAAMEAARGALGDGFGEVGDRGLGLDLATAARHASRARGTRRRPSHGWASLTPTELDVARLVAEGGSNPEIAARLVMSRSTVKTHVSHILTKLGLTSRAQVAAEIARRDGRT